MNDLTDAENEAILAQQKATEAQQKADAPKLTPDQQKAADAQQKADDAKARAAAAGSFGGADGDTSIAEAHVVAGSGADPEMPAGAYEAVKRGNDPSNPKYAPGVSTAPEDQTVKMERVTRDSPEPVYTWVHPDMVGDYVRAGWGRA